MSQWAILSGIEGNLAAYEAVLSDIKRLPVESLYILGDVISAASESEQVVKRLQSPKRGELEPQICRGWWEEQLLTLHALGSTGEPTELIERYGIGTVKTLWDAVPRSAIDWIQAFDFGFFELDCLLIHGSTVSVSDELTPETPPIHLLDRLIRMDANLLFCGRSGLAFQYEIEQGQITSTLTTLNQAATPETATVRPRQIIGVGNVGRTAGQATYTLYSPYSGQIQFRSVRYGISKGFQRGIR